MKQLNRLIITVLLALMMTVQVIAVAKANDVVARWIQLGPGSSPSALNNGQYGDQPSSLAPTILARAIIDQGVCPVLVIDGSYRIPMKTRFTAGQLTNVPGTTGSNNAPTAVNGTYPQYFVDSNATAAANFSDGSPKATTSWTECEAVVPPGHVNASIDGVHLKLPVPNPQKILVIADSGCRMSGSAQQNCHSAMAFPFATLANFAALSKPDLIIHVGDYFYRDTDCTVPPTASVPAHEYVAGCSDPSNASYETWGDTFDSWNADFVYPGKNLLAAAPWVMTRGNHESCGRGARGWFALLDPTPFDNSLVTCPGKAGAALVTNAPVYTGDFRPTYVVPVSEANLLVHDSSYANDAAIDANVAANYDYDLTGLLAKLPVSNYNIFVTHKPAYGLISGAPTNGGDFTEQYLFSGNATSNSAFRGGVVPYGISMFLSGHVHQFEYVNFSDYTHFAPQLIVGIGGDNLDATANPDGTTPTYGYQWKQFTVHSSTSTAEFETATVQSAYSQAEFGYALLTASPTGYIAHVYSLNGNNAGRCVIKLTPRDIACWK